MTRIPSVTGDAGPKVSGSNRQQSERSPSENKERAYVAASRRGDRSIEARVESAKAASKIHFERTGKRLKISEEIVRKEEMYEEEDDHLPLAYRNVVFRPDIPDKFRDYTMIQLGMRHFGADSDAMAKQDNEDRVNSAFAAAFPGINGFQQQPQQQQQQQPQPQPQPDPMQVPLVSPTAFQPSGFQFSDEWNSNSAMPHSTAAQSPGMSQFLPDMHRELSHGSDGLARTPSHESFVVMNRHNSSSSIRSAAMERQGSAASRASSMSHGASIWPPPSPGNMDFDGLFAGPLSATTPTPVSRGMPQSRSMSVPFPNEPRGNRRRRDDSTPALPSPSHGMPLVSPSHAIPPAKRNRSDAGAYLPMNRYPFSMEMPGNAQGMIVQTPSADFQPRQSAAYQQGVAYGQFQDGLTFQQRSQAVPRLQHPPQRKVKGRVQSRAPRQPVSRESTNESEPSPLTRERRPEPTKKIKLETDNKEEALDTTVTPLAQVASPMTETKPVVEAASPATETKPIVEDQPTQDETYTFDGIGGLVGSFGGQDDAGWGLDFNTEDWPAGPVETGPFSFDDLLQFPASQSDE